MSTPHVIPSMGLGLLGFPQISFRRKWRWFMSGKFGSIEIPSTEIRMSGRPYEDGGIITTTVFATDFDDIKQLNQIVQTNLLKKTSNYWIKKNQSKSVREIDLTLYDSCACPMEIWKLKDVMIDSFSMVFADGCITDESVKCDFNWKYSSCDYDPCIAKI